MVTKKATKEDVGKRVRLIYHKYGQLDIVVEGTLDKVSRRGNVKLTDVTELTLSDPLTILKYDSLATFTGHRKYDTFEIVEDAENEEEVTNESTT
jgi:hypothetical protein